MRCDAAIEALIDATIQGTPADAAAADHVRSCVRCTAEAHEIAALWTDLETAMTAPVETAGVDALIAQAHITMNELNRRKTMKKSALLAATVLLSALGGGVAGYSMNDAGTAADTTVAVTAPATDPQPAAGQEFLLLLHESPAAGAPPTDAEMAAIIEEYRQWAGQLSSRGQLVAAEKLADDGGRWLEEAPAHPGDDFVSGYFVIRAPDYDAALDIARGSPHIRYGGRIEVRAIERT